MTRIVCISRDGGEQGVTKGPRSRNPIPPPPHKKIAQRGFAQRHVILYANPRVGEEVTVPPTDFFSLQRGTSNTRSLAQ